ncbi:HNH endonuclease [Actinomarinicola tropica]|uniref:HNH endonuclease n=1 Tax=Actinomarinicola tropica TaxID=2789776 RepID=UPI001899EF8C|nr:HNH endonuclease signature motif containing protein [Actinomarinicola tropica]
MSVTAPSYHWCMDAIERGVSDVVAQVGRELASVLAPERGLDADLELLDATDLLEVTGAVEQAGRLIDALRVALAGAIDRSGAHGVDGHRTAKAALVHLCRVSGPEAHRRVRTARALRRLPDVAGAFAAGRIPLEMAQAIGRATSNPRVQAFLDGADPIFAEQAVEEQHEPFVAWLGEWERLADADGAEQPGDAAHRHRRVTLVQNQADGSWLLRGQFGPVQGAALADVLSGFESAERLADHEAAVTRAGTDATAADHARSASQRRADALVAMAALAATSGAEGRRAEPLVSIVIDQRSYDDGLARLAGARRGPGAAVGADGRGGDRVDLQGRICATTTGHRVTPSDAVAVSLIGHVRRVVIDDDGRVIDLGRRRRLFTGGAREAAVLQAVLDRRGGLACLWSGCHSPPQALQVDHTEQWTRGGCTDVANSSLLCGHHNRLKESGYRPVRGPDDTWQLLRPDGTPITPPV